MTMMDMSDPVMTTNRPQSIIWFERTYWLGFAAVLLDELFALFDGVDSFGPFLVFEIAITVLLWYLIVVKAKDWARWLYIVLTVASVIMVAVLMIEENSLLVFTPWSFVALIANMVAAALLFRIDAMMWVMQSESEERG